MMNSGKRIKLLAVVMAAVIAVRGLASKRMSQDREVLSRGTLKI